jgi:hypothetical protein
MAKRKSPRRGARGRFVKSNAAPRRRRRTARRSMVLANPRRRRASRRAAPRRNFYANPRRRRHARRNPPALFSGNKILGLSMKEMLYAGIGFVAPPAIEGFAKGFLPTSITSTKLGKYALKAGTVALLSIAGSKFINREAGKYIAIGGATYLLANVVVDFLPALFGGFGAYPSAGAVLPRMAARRGLQGQPLMGMYQGIGTSPAKLPERVNPNARF